MPEGNLGRYRAVLDQLADRYRDESRHADWMRLLRTYILHVSELYEDFLQLEPQTSIRYIDFADRFLDRALGRQYARRYRKENEESA